jgi:hypothetical protein
MKAIVHDVYGSADMVRFRDIEMPIIGDDEVLVRMRRPVSTLGYGIS